MPDDVRGWITRQAQENPKWGTKKIRAEMVDWLEKRHPNYPVSGLDAVRKAVSTARGVKSSLDDPWSLGACEEHTILHDATADLLAIWKRSIIGGAKFTIRQAIWAARLKHAVPGTPTRSRLEELRHWAVAYAADARVAEALGETLDTSFLDSNLAFRLLERFPPRMS
jgi:hypothetical protein|tara:strand:+ start:295 stop:798 length:504 start_codon:yes stop_codon:yes gene_type:complete